MKLLTRIRAAGVVAVVCGALLAVPLSAEPAAAWERFYCRGVSGTIEVFVTSNTSPTTNIMEAANRWEYGTSGFALVKTETASARDVAANNKNFGASQWTGKLHDMNDLEGNPDCVNGRWNRSTIIVSVNNYYNPTNHSMRQGTFVHEFGHYLGLAHNRYTASCPGGGTDYLSIMWPTADKYYGNCAIFHPQADDRNGVNAIH